MQSSGQFKNETTQNISTILNKYGTLSVDKAVQGIVVEILYYLFYQGIRH